MVIQDIGELGPDVGGPVVYDWKFYYNLPAAGLWGLLVVAIVLIKDNRNIRALAVLIPVLVIYVSWLVLERMLGMDSALKSLLDQVAALPAIGLAVLWLMGHKIGGRNRLVSFLLAVLITAVVAGVGLLSYGGFDIGQEGIVATILFSVLILAMLLGIVMAGVSCRKRYGPWRFILWQGLWTVAAGLVLVLGYIVVAMLLFRSSVELDMGFFVRMLPQLLMMGLTVGAIGYGVAIPYMVLAFRSRLYRERFYGCLRLQGMGEQVSLGLKREENPG